MNSHKEANDTLLGEKIIIVYDKLTKEPSLYSTQGRHNAQYMIVEGKGKAAFAVIDKRLRYLKNK